MPDLNDVNEIAMALPGTEERPDGHGGGGRTWRLKAGLYVWERGPSKADLSVLEELGREWPDGVVIGVRTDGEDGKAALIQADPDVFFTIPHFDGYPAVLVRLDEIDRGLLTEIITEAWLTRAPKRVASSWLEQHPEVDSNPN